MPSKVERTCEVCGIGFSVPANVVKIGKGRFCSHGCRHVWMRTQRGTDSPRWNNRTVGRKCEYCGRTFIAKAVEIERGYARFCSRPCQFAWRSDDAAANPRKKLIACTCAICGKLFKKSPSAVASGEGRTCSRKCHGIYRSLHLTGEKSANWRGGPQEKSCEFCGKPVHISKARLSDGRGRFCSSTCYHRWYSANIHGENHWNWKGGSRDYPPGWAEFLREEIRERDGRKCVVCGRDETENRRKLHVHHIDYDKNNLSPVNLISLCNSCHPRTNFRRDEWRIRFVTQLGTSGEYAALDAF